LSARNEGSYRSTRSTSTFAESGNIGDRFIGEGVGPTRENLEGAVVARGRRSRAARAGNQDRFAGREGLEARGENRRGRTTLREGGPTRADIRNGSVGKRSRPNPR